MSCVAEYNRCISSNAASCTSCLELGPECGWCAQEVSHFFSFFLPSRLTLSLCYFTALIFCALMVQQEGKKIMLSIRKNYLILCHWKQHIWLDIKLNITFIGKIKIILKWSANHFMVSICSIEGFGKPRQSLLIVQQALAPNSSFSLRCKVLPKLDYSLLFAYKSKVS